jgi:tape measure domain-containing protein|nr:MAG TPA: tail tape measure [Caudoviricetes sp.]
MADSTLTLDAEINTSDWEAGVKTIQSGSRQIEASARQAGEGMDEIDKSSAKASGGTGKFAAIAGAMGGLVSTGVSMAIDAISDLSGDIIEASDSAQKFASTLSFAGLDTGTIDRLTASTQKYADQTVYDLSDIRNTTAQLAANGVDGYAELAEAAGNLNAVAGGNADTFRSVGMVLTQTAGAGKLTTENWNQLSDAIPGASGKLQEAMKQNGAYTGDFRDAMAKGEITAEEFNKAVMDLGMTDAAKEAATSTSTIEGAMGNLEASVVNVGVQLLDSFKGPLTEGMSVFAEGISSLPQAFKSMMGSITPTLQRLGSVFQSSFVPVGQAISGKLLPALQPFMQALQHLGSAIMPILEAAFEALMPVLGSLVTAITQVGGTIMSALTPVINNLAMVFQTVLPVIQQQFQVWGTEIQNIINAVFPFIQTVITTVMTIINGIITTVLAALQGNWNGVWTGIQNIAVRVWNGIQNIVTAGVNAVSGVVSSVMNAVSSTWSGLWNTVKSIAGSAWNGITSAVRNGVNSVANTVNGIGGKIRSAFSGAGSWLVSAGNNIIQGLINGIKGAIGNAVAAVKGAASSIVNAAKGALGIHSPSRVFRDEVGRMIPAGLGKGVEANMSLAVNPVQRMVADIMPNSLLRGPASLPVSSPVVANANGGTRVSAPITVNALDPMAAARETVRMINFAYV